MTPFAELTWQEAMQQGHAALIESEHLYADINAAEGRSNLDIESTCDEQRSKPPRPRSGCELGSQGERYGHPGT